MAYPIKQDYIKFGNSRSGYKISKVRFIVSHDTGNAGSTAHGNRNWFDSAQPYASAHTFIDDNYILEMIPLTEKAWHVQFQKPIDNRMYGDDANDCAIGVELCWGGSIDFKKAYNRYVWYHAYLCKKYGLNPKKDIVSHKTLDPTRKTDPDNALNRYGITWSQFINDVVEEYEGGISVSKAEELQKQIDELRTLVTNTNPNPSEWAVKDWKEATDNGYFDGKRPQAHISRQEAAAVVNRLRHNSK